MVFLSVRPSIKKNILAKTGGRCAHCGKKLRRRNVTVEHVIPLSWIKNETISNWHNDNLVPLCESCNKERSIRNISVIEYYPYLSKSSMNRLIRFLNTYKKGKFKFFVNEGGDKIYEKCYNEYKA